MKFYTYLWLRADGFPYYVGKGKGDRAFKSNGHRVSRPRDSARILVQYWPSERTAFAMERRLIKLYGRLDLGTGCLRNRTSGGDGNSGWKMPKAVKEKIRKKAIGRKATQKTREHMRLSHLGKKLPKGHSRGSRNPAAKLTEGKVRGIRSQYIPRLVTKRMLADMYNVSVGCIKHVLQKQTWI